MASTKLVKKSANQWLKEIANEVGCNIDAVPEEYMTMKQMMEELGLSLGEVESFVSRATKLKIMKKKQFRIDTKGGGIRPVWHYTKI
jgi:hypothetical protein